MGIAAGAVNKGMLVVLYTNAFATMLCNALANNAVLAIVMMAQCVVLHVHQIKYVTMISNVKVVLTGRFQALINYIANVQLVPSGMGHNALVRYQPVTIGFLKRLVPILIAVSTMERRYGNARHALRQTLAQ